MTNTEVQQNQLCCGHKDTVVLPQLALSPTYQPTVADMNQHEPPLTNIKQLNQSNYAQFPLYMIF